MSKPRCFSSCNLLFLFLLLKPSFSLPENHFGDCVPQKCGALSISYPFYMVDQHKPYCGYPGFEVYCKDDEFLYLNISSAGSYVIRNISYDQQTFRVVNSMFFETIGDGLECSGSLQLQNLTFDSNVFKYTADYNDVFLVMKCPESILRGFTPNLVVCGAVAVYENDAKGRDLEGKCNGVVRVPYEGEKGNVGSVKEKLQEGFSLNWTAYNCSACKESGGQCGYDQFSSVFGCFCPDRTHAYSCAKNTNTPKKTENEYYTVCSQAPMSCGDVSKTSRGRCGSDDTSKFVCHCPDGQYSLTCPISHRDKRLPLILGLVVVGGVLTLAALIAICLYRRKLKSSHSKYISRSNSLERSASDVEKGNVYFGLPLFSYNELREATENFDESKELGDGGFGTVYYGILKDGREVAVKRLYEKNYRRVEQFMNEVQLLTCLKHQNLVSLYGCTSHHSKELLLVYEYVSNGTVADHLYGDKAKSGSLPWPVRLKIATETASALCYLHASDIVHRDVKTNNILLDSSFSVKVADFGLSRLFPTDVTHVSTAPQGTPGYLDPEYNQCYQLTDKSDVYSFGVVLVELISSLPAVDFNRHRHEINLSNYAMTRIQRCAFEELVDPELGFTSDFKVRRMTTAVGELAFQCLQHDKEFRPSMDEVVEILKRMESTDYEALHAEEIARDNAGAQITNPQSSPVEEDHAKLLTNHIPCPTSPISVMDKWVSKSTTPSSSN